jgi:prepilin-type N-terminal cleavage/methylation domain-containing protein
MAYLLTSGNRLQHGFTLVEMMIVVAIIAILGAISIPLYNNYIETTQVTAGRANIENLRLAQEDYFLDFNTYVAGNWIPGGSNTLETGDLGWRPDGDEGNYDYEVVAGATGIATSYVLTITNRTNTAITTVCTRDRAVGSFDCVSTF